MIVRYTKAAAHQLAAVLDYIADRSPQSAANIFDRIEGTLALIAEQPGIGRATSRPGFRRINLHPYPYAILYRARVGEIVVYSIRPAARKPLLP